MGTSGRDSLRKYKSAIEPTRSVDIELTNDKDEVMLSAELHESRT